MKQSVSPNGLKTIVYGAMEEKFFEAFAEQIGYQRKTTFFSDLSIAECFGLDSIRDTYNRVVKEWLSNVEYFTEFVMSLNWKANEWYDRVGQESQIGQLYNELYQKADELACNTYKDEEASYYFRTTD